MIFSSDTLESNYVYSKITVRLCLYQVENAIRDETVPLKEEVLPQYEDDTISHAEVLHEATDIVHTKEATSENILHEVQGVVLELL